MDENYTISIQKLLKGMKWNAEFYKADEKRIKLVRHCGDVKEDSCIYNEFNGTAYKLYCTNYELFKKWQSEQEDKNMSNVDYLIVFLGEEQYESRFVGVFRNYGAIKYLGKNHKGNDTSVYDIREIEGFEALKDRVVIDWGRGTQQWMQNWQTQKELRRIEQLDDKDEIPYFTRYEDVVLSFSQLKKVVKDKEWKSKLECLNCVYLILDKACGKQYVGVTYKDMKPGFKNGILNRWTEYAQTGHGGNKLLRKLLSEKGPNYAEKNFQWTILEILPLHVTPKVAIHRENLYKEKFGTREHGYNEN